MIGVGISPCFTRQGFTFSPLALFAAGEQGAWYDPSDWSTLYQDSAGTTPVTAVGQPVGKMLDKSGRGNHATQPTAINRPVIQIDGNGKHYLAFNGTNSWMSTASINFTATDKMTVVTGVRKVTNASAACVIELSTTVGGNNGSFALFGAGNLANDWNILTRGTAGNSAAYLTYAAPVTNVITSKLTTQASTAAAACITRINAGLVNPASSVNGASTGNYGTHPLYIGARAGTSLFSNINLYSLVIRGALSDAAQITAAETFVNSKTGAY